MDTQIKDLSDEFSTVKQSLQKTCDDLKEKLNRSEEESKALKSTNQEQKTKIEALQKTNNSLKSQLKKLTQQIENERTLSEA